MSKTPYNTIPVRNPPYPNPLTCFSKIHDPIPDSMKSPLMHHDNPFETNVPRIMFLTDAPDERPLNEMPFCSPFMVFFVMGIFLSPIWFIAGMAGLCSQKPHEYFVGKLSALICGVLTVIWALVILIVIIMYSSIDES